MRTGRILDSRRTRQQVGLRQFGLSVKATFNPFRDSEGRHHCYAVAAQLGTILLETKLYLVTHLRSGYCFLRVSFADRQTSLRSQTEGSRRTETNPFHVWDNDLANYSRLGTAPDAVPREVRLDCRHAEV
jgi:hypothetical protein